MWNTSRNYFCNTNLNFYLFVNQLYFLKESKYLENCKWIKLINMQGKKLNNLLNIFFIHSVFVFVF